MKKIQNTGGKSLSGLLVSCRRVAQGVLWGIMVLGVYITFRLMDIADMTVDGSFALGACVCAVLVVNKGVNPVLALLVAAAAGVVAGAVTGILLLYLRYQRFWQEF